MPPQTQAPNPLDIQARAALADAAASMSPQSALLAWADWASHLAISPGKQSELAALALEQAAALAGYLRECLMTGPGEARDCIAPPCPGSPLRRTGMAPLAIQPVAPRIPAEPALVGGSHPRRGGGGTPP